MLLRLAATLSAALLAGCSVSVNAPTSAPPQGSANAVPTTVASAESTPSRSPANTQKNWTYHLVASASRPAEATSARIKGGSTTYPNSTSLWVGCDGAVDEVELAVNQKFRRLAGDLGLRTTVPAGLVVHVLVLVDGKPVQNVQLDSDDALPVPINLVLTDARSVTFQSKAVKGSCGESAESYAVLGDGHVE